jgi:hypothetical protein
MHRCIEHYQGRDHAVIVKACLASDFADVFFNTKWFGGERANVSGPEFIKLRKFGSRQSFGGSVPGKNRRHKQRISQADIAYVDLSETFFHRLLLLCG